MKATSAIGVIGACVLILAAGIMEGIEPAALINIPSAIIVFGGTTMAMFAGFGLRMMKIPQLFVKAFTSVPSDISTQVQTLVRFSERARKDGLLALEEDIEHIDDPFLRKGMQLVVDGTAPELLDEILENEIEAMVGRHKSGYGIFEKAGGLAPTIGVLGTVVSLVHVLGNLSSPDELGPLIAGAFLATLYGVGSANVVFYPICYTLQTLSQSEVDQRRLLVEGIMAIQSGDNPRIVMEKLVSFIPPADREAVQNAGGHGTAPTAAAA